MTTAEGSTTKLSDIDYRTGEWLLPATQYQYTQSKLGALSLFTGEVFTAPFKLAWPSILTGMIIIMIIGMMILGGFIGCFVGDIVYPATNPWWFTLETLVMSFGSAALVFLFMYTRSTPSGRPPIEETLQEFALLVAKFGIVHLFFQFTGFYSWAFPDSALGGICTIGYTGNGSGNVAAEIARGIDTGKYSVHDHNNKFVSHEGLKNKEGVPDSAPSFMNRFGARLKALPLFGH